MPRSGMPRSSQRRSIGSEFHDNAQSRARARVCVQQRPGPRPRPGLYPTVLHTQTQQAQQTRQTPQPTNTPPATRNTPSPWDGQTATAERSRRRVRRAPISDAPKMTHATTTRRDADACVTKVRSIQPLCLTIYKMCQNCIGRLA